MSSLYSIIQKQLIIKELFDNKKCIDLRNDIYEYLFLDNIQFTARENKKILVEKLNKYLEKFGNNNEDPHWGLRYGYEIHLQAIQCLQCGGYEYIGGYLFGKVSHSVLCNCPGFNEYYEQHISYLNRPLEFIM
jgi:hypothetical protein